MSTPRRQLIDIIEQGFIPPENIDDALTLAKVKPNGKNWRTFIDHLLLWLGGLALAFALLFFIAYNWKDLGRLAKFGLVEACLVLTIVAYCKLKVDTMASKVSLLGATLSLGVLLALYGQTYQTGADPWQLFFNWGLLMLPWAVIGRFSVLWVVWIALMNTSITLYYLTFRGIFWFVFGSEYTLLWIVFLFNTLAFIAWQFLAKIWNWLSESWAIRLLALSSGVPLTWLVLISIFDYREVNVYPALVWVIWLAAMYYIYRKLKRDIFMLAGCCLSVITITVSFLGKHMLTHMEPAAFLLLALIVIGMGSGSALWLKKVHQECLS
ncbi:DUF2157 domain-containing protein [Desulfogranum japonicum]|uniref:DUF2157 domain-containing protein n=1 Tax=Desulfogranum japonicum TaxID=231447 RepID=UPI000420679D|nr:DUF2157 domain-containing protein [Desulfogranum japonicum]